MFFGLMVDCRQLSTLMKTLRTGARPKHKTIRASREPFENPLQQNLCFSCSFLVPWSWCDLPPPPRPREPPMLDDPRELLARALHSCPPNHRKPHPSHWRLHLEIRCVANLI